MILRRFLALLILVFALAACGTTPEELPEPVAALETAADTFQTANTFKIEVLQEGAPYLIETDVTDEAISFRRALINYQAPDTLQGDVDAALFGLPYNFGILARGEQQWVRLPGIGWSGLYSFAPGFNPQDLIAEESGFQAALGALLDIEMVGADSLDGLPVYHLRGRADGPAVSDLLVGLIEPEGEVFIDVYMERNEARTPVRLVVTLPGTETEAVPEPTAWIVDVYDFDDPVEITGPEAGEAMDVTAEPIEDAGDVEDVTEEATEDSTE